jgi:CheY-like chemotaxis protein
MHTASTEALEAFRARPDAFDLLVTDNTMPKMTGLALAQEVRRIRAELPVLLISGFGEGTDPEELRAKGVDRILPKPYTVGQLAHVIRSLVSGDETREP